LQVQQLNDWIMTQQSPGLGNRRINKATVSSADTGSFRVVDRVFKDLLTGGYR
jgi:hypothetical protein